MNPNKCREYENVIKDIDKKLIKLNEEIQEKQCDKKSLSSRRSELSKKVNAYKSKKDPVSDHARVQYLRRIVGADINELDKTIMAEEDHTNVVKNKIVVTVINKEK